MKENIFLKAVIEKPLLNNEPEDELKGCMNSLTVQYPYFKLFFDYGFGHNHMWVKASGSLERLILVEF